MLTALLPPVTPAKTTTLQSNPNRFSATAEAVKPNALPLHQLGAEFFAHRVARPRFGIQGESRQVPLYDLKQLKQDLMAVQTQPYEARLAVGKRLLDDLHEFGAIRVTNHGVRRSTIAQVYSNIAHTLGAPFDTLQKFVTLETTNFRGLQIKKNDPKSVYHIGPRDNIALKGHENLMQDGMQLFQELNGASRDMLEILSLIYEGRPDGVLTHFALKNPEDNNAVLRQIYYPNAQELDRDGVKITDTLQGNNVRLVPHLDYSLITVLPASKESGLRILPHSKTQNVTTQDEARKIPLSEWIKVKANPDELLIQIGKQMDIATRGMSHPISATWHTVLADEEQMQKSRSSTALFIENELDALPDWRKTLDQGQHVTAKAQVDGQEIEIKSLYSLMGRNAPAKPISQLVPDVVQKNSDLIHLP